MKGLKKLLIPLMVLLLASQALAEVTVTINQPSGQTFFPTTRNERFMDINFTVVQADTTDSNSIYTAIIQFDPENGDANISIAADLNLSTINCSFATSNVWTTPGADCVVRYTFPRTGKTLPTEVFALDVNVAGRDASSNNKGDGTGIAEFGIDNRLVSASVLAILALSTMILAGILILVLAGFIGDVADPQTLVIMAVLGIGTIIGIIIISEVLLLLTP